MGYVIPLLLLFLFFEIIASVQTFRWENNRQHRYIVQSTGNLTTIHKPTKPEIAGIATDSSVLTTNREEAIPTPPPQIQIKKSISPTPISLKTKLQGNSYAVPNIISAINIYRKKNNVNNTLSLDRKLEKYAQTRANYLKSIGKLDNHSSFEVYLKGSAFKDLGFNSLGEIQSEGHLLTEVELIERIFAKSQKHDQIQLNHNWTHVGVGISGSFVNIVFGGE